MAQRRILVGGDKPDNYVQLQAIASRLVEVERCFYQQQAKCAYLKQSDRCNKFFHDLVKRNNKRNSVMAITKAFGEQTTSTREVEEEFVSHFEKLMGKAKTCPPVNATAPIAGPMLTAIQQQLLVAPITNEKIWTALFDIGNDQAPCPGDYDSRFFKTT